MARITCMADVTPTKVRWLWQGWIPYGKLTILEGEPDNGKSTLMLDLISRVTRGDRMPGEVFSRDAAPCIMLAAEDGQDDTLRPRLDSAGADVGKVFVLSALYFPSEDNELLKFIQSTGAKLIVIDPLNSFLDEDVNPNNGPQIRTVLSRLSKAAALTDCAIVIIRHLNKSAGQSAKSRGSGSTDITALARSVMLLAAHPHEPDVSVLASVKCNLAAKPKSRGFRKLAEGDALRIDWDDEPLEYTADELLKEKK